MQSEISDTRSHTHVFHNLSGYEAHLFIKELEEKFKKNDIGVIAENKEK